MKIWPGILVVMSLSSSAIAADHLSVLLHEDDLDPVNSQQGTLGDYQYLVRQLFHDAFTPDVRARMLGEPSFFKEYAVGLRETHGVYSVFWLTPRAQVWKYSLIQMMQKGEMSVNLNREATDKEIERLASSLPANPSDVAVDSCSIEIPASLAQRIINVWRRMLERTQTPNPLPKTFRPPPPPVVTDADNYFFSMPVDGMELAGHTMAIAGNTRPRMLVAISLTMRELCTKRDINLTNRLDSDVANLERELKQGPGDVH